MRSVSIAGLMFKKIYSSVDSTAKEIPLTKRLYPDLEGMKHNGRESWQALIVEEAKKGEEEREQRGRLPPLLP